jgi:hypothetical protein
MVIEVLSSRTIENGGRCCICTRCDYTPVESKSEYGEHIIARNTAPSVSAFDFNSAYTTGIICSNI